MTQKAEDEMPAGCASRTCSAVPHRAMHPGTRLLGCRSLCAVQPPCFHTHRWFFLLLNARQARAVQ